MIAHENRAIKIRFFCYQKYRTSLGKQGIAVPLMQTASGDCLLGSIPNPLCSHNFIVWLRTLWALFIREQRICIDWLFSSFLSLVKERTYIPQNCGIVRPDLGRQVCRRLSEPVGSERCNSVHIFPILCMDTVVVLNYFRNTSTLI